MADTTQRVLRLLGLLEARTTWQAHELAARMDVTERTVRRDVTRLRQLGYPVEAARGLDGGYRMGAGRRLPPLLLDDDEAIALVACLRMGALSGADEVGEAALRALTKLDQVLPPRPRATAHPWTSQFCNGSPRRSATARWYVSTTARPRVRRAHGKWSRRVS